MKMRQLIELMREDRIRDKQVSDLLLDDDFEVQLIHIPTLKDAFKAAMEDEVNTGTIEEAANCDACIKNYLVALDKAVRASKGALRKSN